MTSSPPSERTTVRRLPQRGVYDRSFVESVLDEALVCHVGFVAAGQPYVIPTTCARSGDQLFIHGSAASRMMRTLSAGVEVCVTVTLLDGLVLARSAFHHSMNYRSVVILGRAREVADAEEKRRALEAMVEHVVPGRSREVRGPSVQELAATTVLAVSLAEASAKVRTGPPLDDEADYVVGCWAGEVPLRLEAGPPVPDPHLTEGTPLPARLAAYRRGAGGAWRSPTSASATG